MGISLYIIVGWKIGNTNSVLTVFEIQNHINLQNEII